MNKIENDNFDGSLNITDLQKRLDYLEMIIQLEKKAKETFNDVDFDTSIQYYEAIIQEVKNNEPQRYSLLALLHNNLGTRWVIKKDEHKAIHFYRLAIHYEILSNADSINSLALYRANLAYSLNASGEFEAALEQFELVSEIKIKDSASSEELQRVYFDLGHAYFNLNRFDQAIKSLKLASSYENTLIISDLIAKSYIELDDVESALRFYLDVLHEIQDAEDNYKLRHAYLDRIKRIAFENKLIDLLPNNLRD